MSNGKGSVRRPPSVSEAEWAANWNRIFRGETEHNADDGSAWCAGAGPDAAQRDQEDGEDPRVQVPTP